MKTHEALRSLTEAPLWLCRVKRNYKRLQCRMPVLFRRLRSAAPAARRKKR